MFSPQISFQWPPLRHDTVADRDLQIRVGPVHPDTEIRGGTKSQKKFSRPSWLHSVWSKNEGESGPPCPSPGSNIVIYYNMHGKRNISRLWLPFEFHCMFSLFTSVCFYYQTTFEAPVTHAVCHQILRKRYCWENSS